MIGVLLFLTPTMPQAKSRCEDIPLKELARESAVIINKRDMLVLSRGWGNGSVLKRMKAIA
jgi:hypothetical protein